MKKVFKIVVVLVLLLILLILANVITVWTFEHSISGLDIGIYDKYCDKPYGFPFAYRSYSGPVFYGDSRLHGDCFWESVDSISYTMNIVFWLTFFVGTLFGAQKLAKKSMKKKDQTP